MDSRSQLRRWVSMLKDESNIIIHCYTYGRPISRDSIYWPTESEIDIMCQVPTVLKTPPSPPPSPPPLPPHCGPESPVSPPFDDLETVAKEEEEEQQEEEEEAEEVINVDDSQAQGQDDTDTAPPPSSDGQPPAKKLRSASWP